MTPHRIGDDSSPRAARALLGCPTSLSHALPPVGGRRPPDPARPLRRRSSRSSADRRDARRTPQEVASHIRGHDLQACCGPHARRRVQNVQPRRTRFSSALWCQLRPLASLASRLERWLRCSGRSTLQVVAGAEEKESGWRMKPVDEAKVPTPASAGGVHRAMDRWDRGGGRRRGGLARSAGAQEVFELFIRYGRRDFRDIGTRRSSSQLLADAPDGRLAHAEPVLRSLRTRCSSTTAHPARE